MDQTHDLRIDRVLDAPKAAVWKAWTTPELLKKWFYPAPVQMTECHMDLRPGGIFKTIFKIGEGEEIVNDGVFLEILEGEKIVFTDFFTSGYQPVNEAFFVAIITMSERNGKTSYTALVRHKNEEDKRMHDEKGFYEGWGVVINQLEALAKTL